MADELISINYNSIQVPNWVLRFTSTDGLNINYELENGKRYRVFYNLDEHTITPVIPGNYKYEDFIFSTNNFNIDYPLVKITAFNGGVDFTIIIKASDKKIQLVPFNASTNGNLWKLEELMV